MAFDIPSLRDDRLATQIPERVYGGGPVVDPATTLFIFRTASFSEAARGGVLGFYCDDFRFEALWRNAEQYAERFAAFGWQSLIEPDFSLWADSPLAEQIWNVHRTRFLGRLWQEHGLRVIPSLNWSDERSYPFAFTGIPTNPPVVACECRTAAAEEDRASFLRGLREAVQRIKPGNLIVYGGKRHEAWLQPCLPPGPGYTLLESWSASRHVYLKAQRRGQQNERQMNLFEGGTDAWADVAASA